MALSWVGYGLITSALLGVAALAAERGLGHYRKPVRGVWAGALAGSALLPAVAWLAPALLAWLAPVPEVLPISLAPSSIAVAPGAGGSAASGIGEIAAAAFAWVWLLLAAAFAVRIVGAHRTLRSEMRGWTPGTVLGAPVMVSGDRGPAVVGLRRSVIVMPAWVSELDGALLRLVFLHEREHQRAGDQRLFAAGLLACVAMAWNPIVWWQFRRLRLAIEYDCDRRVLSRGASRREYAEALLTVGRRTLASPLGATAFAERRSAVERRLRRMTAPLGRLRGARAALAGGLGALALALACGSPLPTAPGSGGAPDVPDAGSSVAPADRPASGPYDTPPARKNRAEPLIIVDGVVQGPGSRYRNVADLRALDIDRVEVIKGAAAERIYGTRGADGVIHITTKKH